MNKPVELRDPTIRLIVLAHLGQQFEGFDPSRLEEYQRAGFDPKTIDRFRELKLVDLVRLSQLSRNDSLSIAVNVPNLVADMNRYEHMRADHETYEYCVRNGASASLLMELFNKRPNDIKRMQAMLGIVTQAGRKALPDDDTRFNILADWHHMRVGLTWPHKAREHIVELHGRYPSLTIGQIESVLATYKTQSVDAAPHQRASGAAPAQP